MIPSQPKTVGAASRVGMRAAVRVPSEDFRRISVMKPAKLPRGADALAVDLLGCWRRRSAVLEALRQEADSVDRMEAGAAARTDTDLQRRLRELAVRFRRGQVDRDPALRLEALAHVREAARRMTGLHPFVVQLMGVLALDRGYLAEMATGEGKSLTAALAAVLAAWRGQPCHVVTVNDYLAERDARRFEHFYRFCGVTTAAVTSTMEPVERRAGYAADITYTTSKEVVADFLRDRLRLGNLPQPERRLLRQILDPRRAGTEGLVMRGLGIAIIDEADSVLIDEAVTPLIICQPRASVSMQEATQAAARLTGALREGEHYRVDRQHREIELLDAAEAFLENEVQGMPRFWSGLARRRELLVQAVTARELYQRDRHYVVQDGKVVIVDEFTGRLMPQRTWREGLHQAIEAKEGLVQTPPTEILARLSFQRFFRCYRRLSGMTGTGRETAMEFWRNYRLPVVTIPTNRPCIREQWPDQIFATADARWNAIVDEIVAVHEAGRPVLAGTRSVAASEYLAERLGRRGLRCHVLNAVRHREEAEIVARAGERGRITIATNLAGRGTDILLGGGVAELGGLHVIATEPNESARVDRQLFGRAGRQGNPGSARRFASLNDDLVERFVPNPVRKYLARLVASNAPGELRRRPALLAVRHAQQAAQRLATRQRAAVLGHDTWLDEALSFTGKDPGTS